MSEQLTVQGASMTATSEGGYYELLAADITLNALGNDTIENYGQRNYITIAAGDNSLLNAARGSTISAEGSGNDYLIFNGSSNGFDLGDGSNTIVGVVLRGTEYEQYADFNDDNTLTTGDGRDIITVTGDENLIYAGDGNDTVIVEGDENLILTGYPVWADDEDDEPDTLADDDVMTIRGDDNIISAGHGSNRAELSGNENYYDGAGSDTVRAELTNSTLTGAIDLVIDGDENSIEMIGGRLMSSGDDGLIVLTDGAQATVSGTRLEMTVEGSRLMLDSGEASILATAATIEASTVTSASITSDGELTLNGRQMKGSTVLEIENGLGARATAEDTPLEGFTNVAVTFDGVATIDGVIYTPLTVPSYANTDDGNAIVVKDREITNLGWSEGLQVSTADRYTVNSYAFDVTPDDILVGTNDWAGVLTFNTLDNVMYEGTAFNDNLINEGAGVTVNSGLGVDYISLGSAAREFVVFDGEGSVEVDGFTTGFDETADVLINEATGYDWRIDFGITGVDIWSGDSVMRLVNSGYESVDFLFKDGDDLLRVTALNEGATTSATDANYYFLNESSTLYAGDGTFIVNGLTMPEDYLTGSTVIGSSVSSDYEFTSLLINSPLMGEQTVAGIIGNAEIESIAAAGEFFVFDGAATVDAYTGEGILNGLPIATDGRVTVEVADNAVKSITGAVAGDGITIGASEYTVSADGLSIIDDDGAVLWTGSDVSAVNLMDVYEADEKKAALRELLMTPFDANVILDDEGLRVDVAGLRESIGLLITEFGDQLSTLENATADGIIDVVEGALTAQYGLSLTDVLSATVIEELESRLTTELTSGRTATEALTSAVEAGGLAAFSTELFTGALENKLGVQLSAADAEAYLRGEESALDRVITDVLLPSGFGDGALNVVSEMYETLKYGLTSRLADDGSARVAFEDTNSTVLADLYIGGANVDASGSEAGARIYNGAADNVSITGTAQRDVILAGAGATIDAGAGIEDYVVLASGSITVNVEDTIMSTAVDAATAIEAYIAGATFEDGHTREYISLSDESSVKVFGFEVGFDTTDDVLIVDGDINSLQFAFNEYNDVDVHHGSGVVRLVGKDTLGSGDVVTTSDRPSSDASVDVMLRADNDLIKATAINGGRSVAATGADHYYVGADGTLTGFNGSAVINDVRLDASGALNVLGSTVEGDAGAELAVAYVGGLTANDTISIAQTDGADAINYSVNGDGTTIVRTDKNAVVWSGVSTELAAVNIFAIDDEQYVFDGIEESISAALGRDINLIVSVVDGDSIVGSTGDDMIFAGANDTVDGNGGSDEIYLTPTTIAPALDEYVDGEGARQYVVLNGNATVRGFEAGTLATSDVIIADEPYTLRAESDGLIVENGNGRVLLAGVDADAALMIGDKTASIGSDDTTSETPSDDTTSTAPIDDTTSTAPIVDSSTFIDNSADDINVTLTSAKEGVIGEDATGAKVLTAGARATTLENYAASADVTFFGSAKNDSIVASGGETTIDVSSGGRDTIDVRSGSVNVVGYDATTKSGFAVDGVITFNGNGFTSDDVSVKLEGDHSRGVFAAFFDEEGARQLYGWNDAERVIDGSAYEQSQILKSEGWSTVIGGAKDDTIEATGGDVIQLSRGHDLIVIDDRMKGEVTIDLGTHLTHTTVEGFSAGDVVKVEDVHALKVKETDDGLMLRAGNAHLTLDGVTDTLRVTDGESEFVLHTDYRELVPSASYMLEDESGVIRTPNGSLEIDDDIFTFNGGDNVAIDGFDERWQLRAGEGVEVERMTQLVNGTVQFTTNNGSLKIRK